MEARDLMISDVGLDLSTERRVVFLSETFHFVLCQFTQLIRMSYPVVHSLTEKVENIDPMRTGKPSLMSRYNTRNNLTTFFKNTNE